MIIYQRVFNIKNKNYELIYLTQIYYQTYHLIKLEIFFLCSKLIYNIHIYNKLLSNKINYYLMSIFLYNQTYVINKTIYYILNYKDVIKNKYINYNNSLDISLYIDFIIYIKTNLSPVITTSLFFSPYYFTILKKTYTT